MDYQKLAELWLTTQGRSLWEELEQRLPAQEFERFTLDSRLVIDRRCEVLLLACRYIYTEEAERGIQMAGLKHWHFGNRSLGRIFETGEARPRFWDYALGEYNAVSDRIADEWAGLRSEGEEAELYEAEPWQVAYALALRIVSLRAARDKLSEAAALMRGTAAAGAIGGVSL